MLGNLFHTMRYYGKNAEPVILFQRLYVDLLSEIRKLKGKVTSLKKTPILKREDEDGPSTFLCV